MFYYHPHTGRFEQRARSVVRTSAYSPVPARSYDDDYLYVPFRPLYTPYGRYDSTGEENLSRSQINRELIMSSAAVEDNYDLSVRSRNRDRDVLALANRAIVDTELHSSPRSAVAARRVMRGHSTPPQSTAYSKTEAALIGRKVDVVSPEKGYRRRPKSDYAKAKIRQLESDKRSMELSPVAVQSTTELKASRPSYTPKLIKPIHDVDGVKKQSNILSWQYKLDAITPPDDFIIVPRSLSSVKAQLRQAQDKMTKHRQLMDRYLNTDTGLTMDDQMVLMKMKNSVPNTRAASLNDVKPSDRERKRR